MAITAGYDVGGAHLKVALADNGRIVAVQQIACPLWQGLDRLDAAFAEAASLTRRAQARAVTMTGELCELFPDRPTGVRVILDRLAPLLAPAFAVWLGREGLGTVAAAEARPMLAASTNFLASSALIAARLPDALLVDMGSTTTDIIAIVGGRAAPHGITDGERLATGELVYTGLTRTDVSSVSRRARWRGVDQRLAAGGFATMADVRRVLGELSDDVDQHATADGRGKSTNESLARLARCYGRDTQDATHEEWRAAARDIADQQMLDIEAAMREVLAAHRLPDRAPIVAAGIGAAQVETLAARLGLCSVAFGTVAGATDDCVAWATRCAPAVALAMLTS
jgi:probable H4MPT-linked C1 transfer pathway protein